jgi:ABC-type phosphate/phosphonate transport system ATPase subunit
MKLENLIKTYLESQSNIKSVEFVPNAHMIIGGKSVPGDQTLIRIVRKGFAGDTNSTVSGMNEMFNLELGKSDSKFRVVVH